MLHPEIWADFVRLPHCLGTSRRDHPEWHKGRARYQVWTLDISVAAVEERLRRHRERLGAHVLAAHDRIAHVTVAACGFLLSAAQAQATHDDDVTAARLARQAALVRALGPAPISLVVHGANSFASAPFLEVEDVNGGLGRLRAALLDGRGDFRTTPYVPHVTIGIYGGAHDTSAMARLLRRDDDADPIAVTVAAVGLYSYDAGSIGSPLHLEEALALTRT